MQRSKSRGMDLSIPEFSFKYLEEFRRYEKGARIKISGSGLGYCDLVSFLKNLAIPNAEFGLQIAEFSICFRIGHRDQ